MQLVHIKKEIENNKILNNINLKIEQCSMVFIVGESGAGKSTLLKVMGLLDLEFEGEIEYSKCILQKSKKEQNRILKNYIDFVFQDYNLLGTLTVKENIMLAVELANQPIDIEEYNKIMESMGIKELEYRSIDNLSGGEKQRVAIARALLRKNPIILADEPTGNLDSKNSEKIFCILREVAKDHLVIIVSHDEKSAMQYGDRVIRLKDGEISEYVHLEKDYEQKKIAKMEERKQKSKKKLICKMAYNNLKARKEKVISSILAMMICLLSLGCIIGIVHGMYGLITKINVSILENDKYVITNYTEEEGYKVIDENFEKKILENKQVSKELLYYTECILLRTEQESDYQISTTYNVMDYSDFFKKRYKGINGKTIESMNEVILGKEMANKLYGSENCIGKKIFIETVSGQERECTVVGVFEESEATKISGIFISSELANYFSEHLIDMKYQAITFPEADTGNACSVNVQVLEDEQQMKENIVYGKNSSNEKEILINMNSVNTLLYEMGGTHVYNNEEIKQGKFTKEDKGLLFDTTITLAGSLERLEMKKVRIVGICRKKSSINDIIIYISPKLKESLSKTFYNAMDIYLKNISSSSTEDIYSLVNEYNYRIEQVNGTLGLRIYSKLSIIVSVLSIFLLVILVVTIAILHFSTKLNIIDKIYDIGVLKSLGATDSVIFNIFILENVLLAVGTAIISCLLLKMVEISRLICVDGVNVFYFDFKSGILLIGVSICVVLLSCMYEIVKKAKLSVLDAIDIRYK